MFKKIMLIILIISFLFGIGYYIFQNISFVDDKFTQLPSASEPIDLPEVKQDILGKLNIYLVNSSTKELQKETRNISLKQLNLLPYDTILNELKSPSTSANILSPIPKECTIISVSNNNNLLEITLSDDFINQNTENGLDKLILESIVKTINNLKEIDNIKISIENKPNASLGNYTLNSTYSILDFKE